MTERETIEQLQRDLTEAHKRIKTLRDAVERYRSAAADMEHTVRWHGYRTGYCATCETDSGCAMDDAIEAVLDA